MKKVLLIILIPAIIQAQSLVQQDDSGVYIKRSGEEEVISKRTRNFKVFESGNKGRVAGQVGPIHYRFDPFNTALQYQEIDLIINETPDEDWDAAMETNGYQFRTWRNRFINGRMIRCIGQFKRAYRTITMAPLALIWTNKNSQRQVISFTQDVDFIIDNFAHTVTWLDAFGPGIDFRYNISPDEFFKTVIIRTKSALPEPTINKNGLKLVLIMAVTWDGFLRLDTGFAQGIVPADLSDESEGTVDEALVSVSRTKFMDSFDRGVFYWQIPRAWDSVGNTFDIRMDLRRRGNNVFSLFIVDATILNDESVVYPFYFDTDITEEQVGAGADDARNYGAAHPGDGNFHLTMAYDAVGSVSSNFYMMAARFQTVPLPNGCTLDSADITVRAYSAYTSTGLTVMIACEDVDDAAAFAATTHEPYDSYVAATSNTAEHPVTIDWAVGTWYQFSDMKSPVQEVVNRAGWASDQDLIVVIWQKSVTAGANSRRTRMYEYTGNLSGWKFNASYSLGWTHKFLGVANASISKILGIAKTSINKVMGVD